MSLDIEGVGYEALSSNDWSDPLCIPQFIIVEDIYSKVSEGGSVK